MIGEHHRAFTRCLLALVHSTVYTVYMHLYAFEVETFEFFTFTIPHLFGTEFVASSNPSAMCIFGEEQLQRMFVNMFHAKQVFLPGWVFRIFPFKSALDFFL